MRKIILRIGLVVGFVVTGFLAASALVSSGLLANSEAATSNGARNSVVSGTAKTPMKNAADPSVTDIPETEYKRRLTRIKQLADEGNLQELVKEGDDIHKIWGSGGGERFARLTLEVINAFCLSRVLDENPEAWDLREKYARAALATSDSYGIESELNLVGQISYLAHVSSFSEAEVLRLRTGSRLWLHLLTRLESEKDPSVNLDPYQSLPNHLTTTYELRSVEIVDPLAAARLRTAETEHQEKLKKISYQFQLRNLSEIAERSGTRFLANVYSRSPFSREELSALLSEHPIAESLRRSILKARDDLMRRS
jgi:hypothetical protein